MSRVVLLYAHPYPQRSRAGRAMLDAVRELPSVDVRSLYDLYPDFAIDVAAEQAAVDEASILVWQCPFYWYGIPSLMHLWFEKVLTAGWAYGPTGGALVGKRVLWVTTTGTPPSAYRPEGMHAHPFEAFVPPIEQTARFCGMTWEPPIVVENAHQLGPEGVAKHAASYRARIEELARG